MKRVAWFLFALTTLAVSGTVHAEWHRAGFAPQHITNLAMSEDGQRMLASYYRGGLWLSNDGGSSWTPINSRLRTGSNQQLKVNDIFSLDPQADTLVVSVIRLSDFNPDAPNPAYFTSMDGGQTWVPGTVDSLGLSSNTPFIIDPQDHSRWFYCNRSSFFVSTNYGQTWTRRFFAPQNWPNALYLDPQYEHTVYALGTYYPDASATRPTGLVRSTDDGESWETLLFTESADVDYYYPQTMIRLHDGTLLVHLYETSTSQDSTHSLVFQLMTSDDDGVTWSQSPAEGLPNCDINAMVESPTEPWNLYAFCGNLYRSSDDGATWQVVTGDSLPERYYNGQLVVSYSDPNSLTVSLDDKGTYRSTDGGTTWRSVSLPDVDASTYPSITSRGTMFNAKDAIWISEPDNPGQLTRVGFPSAPDSLLSAYSPIWWDGDFIAASASVRSVLDIYNDPSINFLLVSQNHGQTWERRYCQDSTGSMNYSIVRAYENGDSLTFIGYNWADNSTFFSSDTGRTWIQNDLLPGPLNSSVIQNDTLVAYSAPTGSFRDLLISYDGGHSWSETGLTTSIGTYLNSGPYWIHGDMVVVWDDQVMVKSPNGEWQTRGAIPPYSGIYSLSEAFPLSDGGSMLITVAEYSREVYVSYDYGANWELDDLGLFDDDPGAGLLNIYYDPYRQRLWAYTGTRLVWADVSNLSVGEKPHFQPVDFSLGDAWPNPFNASTKVTYSLSKPGSVHLDVYDLLGRHVANLASGPVAAGRHTVTFDASNLASGTYFLNMRAEGRTATKRVVLMK